jgi:replicative DNA helicase
MQTDTPTSSPGVPHSREAEEAAIGAVLINPETYYQVKQHIKHAEEFYIHRLRWVWEAYEALKNRDADIDLLTLSDQLERKGLLDEVGGSAYLTSLITQVPNSNNTENYAAIVHEHYVRRKLLTAANEIASLAYKDETIEGILSKSTGVLSDAMAAGIRARTATLSEGLIALDAKIEERRLTKKPLGIPTGLVDLDKKLGGGAKDGDLLMISARPGKGKTSLLLQLARFAAMYREGSLEPRKRVVFFSLEMSAEQLMLRLLAQISGIDYQQLESGTYPDHKYETYLAALDELAQLEIVVDDTPSVTPAYIGSRLNILNMEKKVDIFFVDSLNLMSSNTDFQNRTDLAMDQKAMDLKNIARRMNIPCWVAHQMNRTIERRPENAKPMLSDLAEGGERPTDIVIFIWHKMDEVKGDIERSELCVEKHRNGPTGDVPIVFRKELTLFESAYVSIKSFK